MRLLGLFDIYFLFIVIIQGLITLAIDYVNFKKRKMNKNALQAKIIGIVSISIALALYILKKMFYKY